MIVSIPDIITAATIANGVGPAKKLVELLQSFSDKDFFTRSASLIMRSGAEDLTADEEAQRNVEAQRQSICIYGILGPLYVAGGRKLPMVTGDKLAQLLDEEKLDNVNLEEFFRQFEHYNPAWFGALLQCLSTMKSEFSRAVVYWVTKPFLDALPEPIEPYELENQDKEKIQNQVDDILGD